MKLEFGTGTGSKLVQLPQFGMGFIPTPTDWRQRNPTQGNPRFQGVDQAGNLAPVGGTLREQRGAQPYPRGKMRMTEAPGELQNAQWGCQSIRVTTMERKSS